MKCPNCGNQNPDNEKICQECGYDMSNVQHIQVPKFDMPMKWYMFLVIFWLPLNAFFNIINGIQFIIYPKVSFEQLSELGDISVVALEKLNVFYGICLVVIGVFMIYTLRNLRAFKKISLLCIQSVYVFNALVTLFQFIMTLYITGLQGSHLAYPIIYATAIATIFMIIVNTVYFNKRKHLFVN